MREQLSQNYIITGGPGVGKTTLLQHLNNYGYATVSEDARQIIKEQLASGGTALPWRNKKEYACLMYKASIRSYQNIQGQSPEIVFFDRGIVDAVCYMAMENIPWPENIYDVLSECRYNKRVFLLPPWKKIYSTDNERKQNWDEAVYTFGKIKETYQILGFELVEVPKGIVGNRLAFVMDKIKNVTA